MITVNSNFPGGNIILESVDGDTVYLHQDLRDTVEDWFYWYFSVNNAQDRLVRFVFTKSQAIGVRGPAVSLDKGQTWRWLGKDVGSGNSFSYRFCPTDNEVRFSFGMPYLESNWNSFFGSQLADSSLIKKSVLCTTPKGREVELLTISNPSKPLKWRVLITCRHHACEMMASYSLEGLISYIVKSKTEDAMWLRENIEFVIIPFMDKDGVEDGDQGKSRSPHDHNRDYIKHGIHSSVQSLMKKTDLWIDNKLVAAIDLHCPWIKGWHNEDIYLVGSQDDVMAQRQKVFSRIIEQSVKGELPFNASNFLPFGKEWNTTIPSETRACFHHWAETISGIKMVTSMEIPYANAGGKEVNAESASSFGTDLAASIYAYLKEMERL